MKKNIPTFFLMLLLFNCKQQIHTNSHKVLKTDGIKGRVKSVTTSSFTLNPNSTEQPKKGSLAERYFVSYDTAGNRLMSINFDAKDSIVSKTSLSYEFNQNGKIITTRYFDKKDTLISTIRYKYNNLKQISTETWYGSNNTVKFSLNYTYDKNGNKVEETKIDNDGSLINTYKSKYDDSNREIKRENYDYDGKLQFSDNFKYDIDDNQIELAHMDKDGEITLKNKMEYNKEGYVIKIEKYQSNNMAGQNQAFKYDHYDCNGNPTTAIFMVEQKPVAMSESSIVYY